MAVLECTGVFELVVPDSWEVSGSPGEYYEIVPTSGLDLAVNISVYAPTPARVQVEGPGAMLRRFVSSTGFENVDALEYVEPSEADQARCFTHFNHDGRAWAAGFLVFRGGAVLATANAAEADAAGLREGQAVIVSITPERHLRPLGP